MNQTRMGEYDGAFYRPIGDFVRGRYLDWDFTKGTKQEVDFLIELLNLPSGSRILDIGCGVGRHSLELARRGRGEGRGYRITGLDISSGMIEVGKKTARRENLDVDFIVADAREMNFDNEFDAAICLCEGAFGLLGSQANHLDVLKRVHRSLRDQGLFVLTAIHALSAARNATEGSAGADFDCYTCTGTERLTIRNEADEARDVQIWTTSFTYPHLALMFELTGFAVEAGYGCVAGRFGRKMLEPDDVEIMMVGRKVE